MTHDGQVSTRFDDEPILAVCGFSGSGKTTLLETVIGELAGSGLGVGVVKHDAHGLDIDRPGKDSDRLFRAGAEVCLRGPGEIAWRRRSGQGTSLEAVLAELLGRCDLVLVEGHRSTPLPKVWLNGPGGGAPPPGTGNVLAVFEWDADRPDRLLRIVEERIGAAWRSRHLLGGLLVGGGSTRMGRPKQLLEHGGITFAEIAHAALAPHVERVVLLGGGELPPALRGLERLPDPPALAGPMAGLAAALRWAPRAAWLLVACDLPRLSREVLAWLVEQRAPGRRAVLPTGPSGRIEPLLAVYEPAVRSAVEELAARGELAPRRLRGLPGIVSPTVPPHLAPAFLNVNGPADLDALGR
ncbi:MAG: molybdopterin-guanine dinucleotide biosynthesis protein B [Acidobacteria bacterium]|nr:molybdopterin-guanine dinucleotide biosynthesis protein B [Acidobacteriota bacterium]